MSRHYPAFVTAALAPFVCLAICTAASAFSIGALETRALAPGEPFDARIPLFFETYENPHAPLNASLPEAADYPPHAPPPPPFLDAITIERSGDRLRLSTTAALPPGALDDLPPGGWGLLVRAERVDGASITHLYRLRPPVSTPAASGAEPAAAAAPPSVRAVTPARPGLPPGDAAYGPVAKGQSLYRIAARLGFHGDATWLAAYALWQRNAASGAFVRNNMHGLRAGAVLAVPADLASRIASYDPAVVRFLAEQHRKAWRDRQTLPQPAPTSPPAANRQDPAPHRTGPDPPAAPATGSPPPRSAGIPSTTAAMTFPTGRHAAEAAPTPIQPPPARLPRQTAHAASPAPVPTPPPDVPDRLAAALRPLDAYLTAHVGAARLVPPPTGDPAARAGATAMLATAAVACLLANTIAAVRRRRRQRQLDT